MILSMFFYVTDSRWSFSVEANHSRFLYICIAVGDPVIKRTWISNIISRGLTILCSVSYGERGLFDLLILVELLTFTV